MRHASIKDIERGSRIRALRKVKYMTQGELADKVNRTTSAISKIEGGEGISNDLLSKLCDVLEVELSYILTGDKKSIKPAEKENILPSTVNNNYEKLIEAHEGQISALKQMVELLQQQNIALQSQNLKLIDEHGILRGEIEECKTKRMQLELTIKDLEHDLRSLDRGKDQRSA